MSRRDSSLRDIIKVAMSHGVSLASGVVVGLLLPKVLGVEDYGFLKIYTLYVTYTALLHFGFVDGVLLKLAGSDYDALDRRRLRSYSRFFLVFQLIIGGAIALAGFLLQEPDLRFICAMLGINLVIINLTTYYQFISQATQRFSEYTAKSYIGSCAKLLLVLGLFAAGQWGGLGVSYRLYVVFLNLLDGGMLLWYVYTYRDITFGPGEGLRGVAGELKQMFRTGILLTVAYQASHLLLVLDRQFVSVLFDTATYGQYAFAYNLVTLISTMVSALSVVLLPKLKRTARQEASANYPKILSVVAVLVCCGIAGYFPLVVFIRWFLPDYDPSIAYLRIILPALTFSCCVNVVMFTFSKVLDRNRQFFVRSLLAMALGAGLNFVAWRFLGSPEAISWASLVTMVCWFAMNAELMKQSVGAGSGRVLVYLCLVSAAFLGITWVIPNPWLGLAVYGCAVAALTAALLGRQVMAVFRKGKNI